MSRCHVPPRDYPNTWPGRSPAHGNILSFNSKLSKHDTDQPLPVGGVTVLELIEADADQVTRHRLVLALLVVLHL